MPYTLREARNMALALKEAVEKAAGERRRSTQNNDTAKTSSAGPAGLVKKEQSRDTLAATVGMGHTRYEQMMRRLENYLFYQMAVFCP